MYISVQHDATSYRCTASKRGELIPHPGSTRLTAVVAGEIDKALGGANSLDHALQARSRRDGVICRDPSVSPRTLSQGHGSCGGPARDTVATAILRAGASAILHPPPKQPEGMAAYREQAESDRGRFH